MTVRLATLADLHGIREIENHEIEHGFAHFGLEPVSLDQLRTQFETTGDRYPWFVAIEDGEVIGFCRASPWKARAAYSRTAEIGVYIATAWQGRGVGRELYRALLDRLKELGFHTILAGIALPNPASVRLHESFGMKQVALLPEVGHKHGAWRDTGYWAITFP